MTRQPVAEVLELPGMKLHYDVHGDLTDPGPQPVLLVFGFPMEADAFAALASRIDDRVVVTVDPRGVGRSTRNAGDDRLLAPDDHARDLAALVDALDVGQVDVFGTSGGGINALSFAEAYPEKVRLLVSHEPPLTWLLPDREAIEAVIDDILATYQESGYGPAMAKFIRLVIHDGEIGEQYLRQPPPDPAKFGLPTEDDGLRDDPMLAGSLHNGPGYRLDVEALRALGDRVIIAVGEQSGQTMAARAARAAAALLGQEPVMFPSHHGGFLEGEPGQAGKPDEFAARLRAVLERS